ncbi:hypothetical protein L208DRAFT_635513 [Tricholoma matsutake]|nr:hypothetical protein L208DRAFT_635513 [Tricholoma matsutake 945]
MQPHISLVSPLLHATSSPDHRFESLPRSPASSVLSDLPQPPAKKRRMSTSSLSDAEEAAFVAEAVDDDDEEEDEPLAARMTATSSALRPEKSVRVPGQRSGKKIAHNAPISHPPPAGEQLQINGVTKGTKGHDPAVKVEDVMDENQLTRLATGVTVDTARATTAGPPIRQEKAAAIEFRKGVIQITPVENDRSHRSLVILTGLKTLFQKQLPNMPREYIARLVYDANSKDLAIIKRAYKVVGGICYRPFPHRGFAEIVFFATASVDQEKGYGGMLMDHFKAHIQKTYPDMMHFLTYADNYAVGYFEKQGFSKDITLDRSVWAAYIKDYEGGTIMQCTMLRKVDYLNKADIISQQQEAVMTKIRQMSKSHIVHPGLPQFQPGAPECITVDPKHVPGLRESGWNSSMVLNAMRPAPRNADNHYLARILSDLVANSLSWPFREPVKPEDVPDYYDVIKNPMDLLTMQHKLDTNQYSTIEAFLADTQLLFDNCRLYNPENTIYSRNATKLEAYLKDVLLPERPG